MWKQLLTLARQMLNLAEDTERNKTRIQELQDDVERLTGQVQWLTFEFRRVMENEAHERGKLALQMENQLLRFERRLPSAGKSKD